MQNVALEARRDPKQQNPTGRHQTAFIDLYFSHMSNVLALNGINKRTGTRGKVKRIQARVKDKWLNAKTKNM